MKKSSVEDVIIDQFMFNFAINYDSIIKNIHVENGKKKRNESYTKITDKNTHTCSSSSRTSRRRFTNTEERDRIE